MISRPLVGKKTKMPQIAAIKYTSKPDRIIVCHGCLVSDVKLFDTVKYNLADLFSDLIGREINFMAEVPQHLCSYCTQLLLNYNTFKTRCTLAQELLQKAHRKKRVTIEKINKIDRQSNYLVLPYTRTKVNITSVTNEEYNLDINHDNNIYSYEHTLTPVSNDDKVIKTELKVDEIADIKLETRTYLDNDLESVEETFDSESNCFGNISNINVSELKVNDTEMVADKDFEQNNFNVLKVTKKRSSKNKYHNRKPIGETKLRSSTKPKDLSKDLNVDIKFLGYEEQVRELEKRKLTVNYKRSPYKCDQCYKGFIVEDAYNRHMVVHTAMKGNLICDICKFRYRNKETLLSHMRTHLMIFTCKECGHVSTQMKMAIIHHKFHTGAKYPCKYCSTAYNRLTTYYSHMKNVHSSTLLRCEICGESVNGPIGLSAHERKTHIVSPDCKCSRCGVQFYTKEAFDTHRSNDGLCDLTLKSCTRCGATFATDEMLKEHEIEQQKYEGYVECSLCTKKFYNLDYYKHHLLRLHPGTLPFKDNYKLVRDEQYCMNNGSKQLGKYKGCSSLLCEICGKITKNNALLQLHLREKHSGKDCGWPFQCNVCHKTLRSRRSLEDHARTHTNERPFQCQLCSKSFNIVQNLKRHSIVHTRDRPHSCHICEKRFQTTSCVRVHIRNVHMKVPQEPRKRKKKNNKIKCC